MVEVVFVHSKEHLPIARAEVSSLFNGSFSFFSNLTFFNSSLSVDYSLFERLAFTRQAFIVVSKSSSIDSLLPSSISFSGSVSIDYFDFSSSKDFSSSFIRDFVLKKLGSVVNLSNPDHSIAVFNVNNEFFFCKRIFVNNNDFSSRKNHNLPSPHPTSSHPKLLRALVNLSSAKNEVLDPFCGSAGILLEAGLIGLRIVGVDIDPLMIKRARDNLSFFNLEADLFVGDALSFEGFFEAVVTDLPYGRNSKSSSLVNLYSSFLKKLPSLASKAVVCFPSIVDHESIVSESGLKVVHHFSWYIHKSLSKHIYVFKL